MARVAVDTRPARLAIESQAGATGHPHSRQTALLDVPPARGLLGTWDEGFRMSLVIVFHGIPVDKPEICTLKGIREGAHVAGRRPEGEDRCLMIEIGLGKVLRR